MIDIEKKTKKEQETIAYMITYYCRKHHGFTLCVSCSELLDYANQRILGCPFKETKTFCSACKVHCYKKEKRDQIKAVMRYSGPRMMIHRPFMALHHLYIEKKEKRQA